MGRKSWIWLLAFLMLVAVPVHAQAGGSIHLDMRYEGTAVSGGTVTMYDVTGLMLSDDPESMLRTVKGLGLDSITQPVGPDGKVSFHGLADGNYLFTQDTAPEGYYPVKAFWVSIPVMDGDQLCYRIDAAPKLQRIPEAELPQTGQRNLPVWGLLGGGLALIAAGIELQKRK